MKKQSDTQTSSEELEDSDLGYKGLGVHDPNTGEAKMVYFPEGIAPPVKPSNALVSQKLTNTQTNSLNKSSQQSKTMGMQQR